MICRQGQQVARCIDIRYNYFWDVTSRSKGWWGWTSAGRASPCACGYAPAPRAAPSLAGTACPAPTFQGSPTNDRVGASAGGKTCWNSGPTRLSSTDTRPSSRKGKEYLQASSRPRSVGQERARAVRKQVRLRARVHHSVGSPGLLHAGTTGAPDSPHQALLPPAHS